MTDDKRYSPDERLARFIEESAKQIFNAGLGALATAEKEGSKLFEQLSKLGENLESRTRKTASAAGSTVRGAKHTATETWDKLEEMFELRVARALNSLQIPTARDIAELRDRVDELSRAVDKLAAKKGGAAQKKKLAPKKKKKRKKKETKKKKKGLRGVATSKSGK